MSQRYAGRSKARAWWMVRVFVVVNAALLASMAVCFWLLSTLEDEEFDILRRFGALGSARGKGFNFRSACSSKVRGPIPTTLPAKRNATSCIWKESPGKVFELLAGSSLEGTMEKAKLECSRLGNSCRGISCRRKCSAMVGQLLPNNETTSFVKMCLHSGDALEEGMLPAAAKSIAIHAAAVVILAHNRQRDLAACLKSLLQLEDSKLFEIYVSVDDHEAYTSMHATVMELSDRYGQSIPVWNVSERKIGADDNEEQKKWFQTSTGRIAHHYWTVFERVFMVQKHDMAIFLEEDLIVAPDFLALFRSTAWVIRDDPSIWCVSAWNDVGFAFGVSDQCRLFRTTYFPGLGFMLQRQVWLQLREEWPSVPTMGWDYWMRTAFRRADKECIVPEVPRSRHQSREGSSIVTEDQVLFFELFAFADLASTCDAKDLSTPCNQFGDISYLFRIQYEFFLRTALSKAETMSGRSQLIQTGHECASEAIDLGRQESPDDCALLVGIGDCSQYFGFSEENLHWGCRCCREMQGGPGKEHAHWSIYAAARTVDPGKLYVYPFKSEEYWWIAKSFGLQPEGMEHMIPADIRAEHYGLIVGRHLTSGAVTLLVDQRSSRQYLPPDKRLTPSMKLVPVAGHQGKSCEESCQEDDMACDADQFHFLNDCNVLSKQFGCRFCAHQAGEELPAYVVADFEPTVGQCLVTFVSPFHCGTKHPSTRRLCPCMPHADSEDLLQ